jgi:hypothetical protein
MFVGFCYSGMATVRLSWQLFRKPAASGPDATIDNLISVANVASGQALRDAVNGAGWPVTDDVVVVGDAANRDLAQIYQSASYLLYPRRLWLAFDLSAASARARHLIVIGRPSGLSESAGRPISSGLRLVDVN